MTLDIDATTTYVNNVVEILYSPGDAVIFTAPTCGYYDTGYDVTIQVYNPHNPTNDPNMGIVYFAATNKMTNGVSEIAFDYRVWCVSEDEELLMLL